MDNKCPKCGEKLRLTDLKPLCPHCGCNIMYYNMESRLDVDVEKAEAEWAALDRMVKKITPGFLKKKKEKKENEKAQ